MESVRDLGFGLSAPGVTAGVAAVVAVAGLLAFIRRRTFKPRVSITLSAELWHVQGGAALHIDVTVRNGGQSALLMDPCYRQLLAVFVADEAVWADAVEHDDGVVLWFDGTEPHRQLDLLDLPGLETWDPWGSAARQTERAVPALAALEVVHGLEAGEDERAAVLVPVADAHAYLVVVGFQTCGHVHWWSRLTHRRCVGGSSPPDLWLARTIVRGSGVERGVLNV